MCAIHSGGKPTNSGYELRAPLLVGPMWQQPSKCRLGRKAQTQCSTVHNRCNVRCNVGCNVGLNVGLNVGSMWTQCGAQYGRGAAWGAAHGPMWGASNHVGRRIATQSSFARRAHARVGREQNCEQDASRCLKRREHFCKVPHLLFAARPHTPTMVEPRRPRVPTGALAHCGTGWVVAGERP